MFVNIGVPLLIIAVVTLFLYFILQRIKFCKKTINPIRQHEAYPEQNVPLSTRIRRTWMHKRQYQPDGFPTTTDKSGDVEEQREIPQTNATNPSHFLLNTFLPFINNETEQPRVHAPQQRTEIHKLPMAQVNMLGKVIGTERCPEIKHRPERLHSNVDALSRAHCNMLRLVTNADPALDEESEENHDELLSCIKQFKQKQQHDLFCRPLIDYFAYDYLPDNPKQAQNIVYSSTQFTLLNDLLYYVGTPINEQINTQLVVPRTMRHEILDAMHSDVFVGHFGFKKTYARIRNRYYWPGMYSDVKEYCEQCANCTSRKNPNKTTRASLVSIPVEGPFDRVAVDILGPLPLTVNGNRYVIVFSDYLTKFAMAVALHTYDAKSTAQAFLTEVVLRHGAPNSLLSDRGTNFLSDLMHEICELCNTRKINTTPYHPQTDGLVEAYNKTLVNTISAYVGKGGKDWDTYLPYAVFAYNSSEQRSTKQTPFFLLYGREPQLPIDAALNFKPSRYTIDLDDYALEVPRLMAAAWHNARQCIVKSQEQQRAQYNKTQRNAYYDLGDLVYRYIGKQHKFSHPWRGPYVIKEIRYPNVRLQPAHDKDAPTEWIHVNIIKPAHPSQRPPTDMPIETLQQNDDRNEMRPSCKRKTLAHPKKPPQSDSLTPTSNDVQMDPPQRNGQTQTKASPTKSPITESIEKANSDNIQTNRSPYNLRRRETVKPPTRFGE